MTYSRSVLHAARDIRIEVAEMPGDIAPDHVRLRLAVASICGTDMHYFRHFANAGFFLDNPVTLGHEACAYIEDANGHSFEKGDLVAINPVIECGTCEKCLTGDINMCPAKRFPGSATTKPHIDGFFREYFDFPARCCHKVPDSVAPHHLTFAEPLACAMHSVNRAGVSAGQKVLVTGCGPMGLLATIGAAAKGAEVEVTDLKPEAIAAAQAVGAKGGFPVGTETPPDSGYDVVIEASGSPHGYNQALGAVRKQGVISVLSLIQASETPINLHLNALKEVTSVGSILFTSEFGEAVSLIAGGTVDFDAIIAGRYPVSHTQAACDFMANGEAVGKVLITPDG
ncbi:zinc-dependent alcohol dehydrogenase [Hoeflea prorocentri]|uniref:Alcohol dehydrogenase catalytic domain-containing protein n=1 Tax=Hoeflea prorocentri TaxID=1922333 RepID=A0A9X3UEJ3_9HYPH|nr:alcohol dehydrogenase catalytic domain-containing protein [Hoeflea prorocentri]MCY6379417.1 alcohol dehydrogenase catalytic domain-containing protein [Hoeflea prorocentri]MDA5397218.1 alcohol dehydrogenase catalytic domain-containing protein [Hoeflea prorocentri]